MSGMEAVVIHSESPSRLETYLYLVITIAGIDCGADAENTYHVDWRQECMAHG